MEFVCVCVLHVNLRPPGGQYINYVAPTIIQVAHPWYRAYTLSRLPPQSVPSADLSTLGPIIVLGVRFRGSVTASCERTGYTKEKSSGYNRLRSCLNSTLVYHRHSIH